MDKVRKTLEQIGLNEKEIKIYLTSLTVGQSPASILGQRNNIVRSTAQYTCQSLAEKGLMNVTPKGNTFLYSPAQPEKLLSLVNKEYDRVEKKFNSTRQIMGDLKAMMNPHMNLPKVKYFTGIEGMIDMFEDILEQGETVYGALDMLNDIPPELGEYLSQEYIPKRVQLGIQTRGMINYGDMTQDYRSGDKKKLTTTMYIGKEDYPFDADINIYGDKVSFFSFQDLTGVVIKNEKIAKSMRSLYRATWNAIRNYPENEIYKNQEL